MGAPGPPAEDGAAAGGGGDGGGCLPRTDGSFLASSRMGPLLFDTSPRDPQVLAGVATVLILVALVAGGIPAWAAARVDPMEALREE